MWSGIKFGVILLVLHSTYGAQEYFESDTFDLRHAIPGEPEVDYPIYSVAPRTSFSCVGRHEGYYADMEARCQVFRICSNTDFTGRGFPFLCPNGTLFNQELFVCDWYRNVDCDGSEEFFVKNSENGLESKSQMMRKAQMMVEFPMRSLRKAESHFSSVQPKPIVKISPRTQEAVLRVANHPERATPTPTQGSPVFVSSLGELSSDVHTSFNPDTSVIVNNDSPSQILEAPHYLDLGSIVSNINNLVEDVESDGELIPNVISARSPKLPVVKYMSKGFSMPQKNYKKTQQEQALLNPQPVQSVFSVAPFISNFQPQAALGRSYQNFYPQQPQYLNLPQSSAVTTQLPDITSHTKLQKVHPDIVIARSEEHSPFPLESRTARATPAPPSSGKYVPLKQYINTNFQSGSYSPKPQPHQKTYPNYNYAQPQNAVQYKSQPQSAAATQYQKQQPQSATQYQKQQPAAATQYQKQQPAAVTQYKKQQPAAATQYQKQQPQSTTQYQNQPTNNKISTVQEKIPLFPPLVQLKAQPQPQAKKQSFQTYQQFAFKTIPIAQRRFGLAEFEEAKKPNYSLFNGVSSYDVPLSSIGVLRSMKQQRLQSNRVQG